jgi:hypothetical protein
MAPGGIDEAFHLVLFLTSYIGISKIGSYANKLNSSPIVSKT